MIVLGIDVAKAKLDAALWLSAGRRWDACKVSNDAAGCRKLLTWAQARSKASPDAIRVVMEATGVYHELAAEVFHDAGCTVIVANPKRARDFAKGIGVLTKNDTVDAKALACYGEHGRGLPWQPPAEEVRVLRALLSRLAAIDEDLRREKNRLEKSLIATAPDVVLQSLQRNISALQTEHRRLHHAVDDHYDQHPDLKADRDRLLTVPAIGPVSADLLICLLRGRHFDSARQAAALSGLVPLERSSGTSVRGRPHLSKQGDARLRAVLYMASIVSLKCNPQMKSIYDRLVSNGKAKKAALGALMRHFVHIAFGILKHHQSYNPALVSKTA